MSPSVDLLTQPWADGTQLAAALVDLFDDPVIEEVTLVVAWLRFRGLVRLRREVMAFRARGGHLRLIVGVDEGGATRPGLLLAVRLADDAFVFHDRSAGTFHPKLFFAEGATKAVVISGSSNVTPGGLYGNYEVSLRATFVLPAEEDGAVKDARHFIASLMDEPSLCLELDAATVDQLVADLSLFVAGHERPSGRGDARRRSAREDAPETMFGSRAKRILTAPSISTNDLAELASFELGIEDDADSEAASGDAPAVGSAFEDEAALPSLASADEADESDGGTLLVLASWTKRLPQGDAQQNPNPRTSPTGNLRLTRAGHDIDQTTFFREVLFGKARWSSTGQNDLETATVTMHVTIGGASAGLMEFEVTHAPHRESGQGNHTTAIKWGPLLPTLKTVDYTDYTVSLSAISDGSYRMAISA